MISAGKGVGEVDFLAKKLGGAVNAAAEAILEARHAAFFVADGALSGFFVVDSAARAAKALTLSWACLEHTFALAGGAATMIGPATYMVA